MRTADMVIAAEAMTHAMLPLIRAQLRNQLLAAALQGLVTREPGNVSTDDEEDLAAQAVRLVDLVMAKADERPV